ncbi:hypothetical protein DPMN_126241 [Dreissena polymorpha]|uniref:Uncharacterized protein n=1 Tax=Dreissena polymorpha TaxID=45954 RepID=A0A9D4JTS1_DREPO|nr:hypothetical protein DPMN_126241 [Dreissena polymorpha]
MMGESTRHKWVKFSITCAPTSAGFNLKLGQHRVVPSEHYGAVLSKRPKLGVDFHFI